MIKLILIVSFFSLNAFSYNGFRCIPSLKQTRLQVLEKTDGIEVLVVNPSGYEFMPQFDGSGAAFSIAFNKMQAEDLKGLGDGFIYNWKSKDCTLDADALTINCNGEAKNGVNAIKSFGISTTEISEKYQTDTYEKRRYRLNVEKDNNYFVNLEFYKQNCEKF